MTILQVITEPNPLLREISQPVLKFDEDLRSFMNSMLETMYQEGGIGIAAIQVGNPITALIVDIPVRTRDENDILIEKRAPIFIINPVIKYLSEEKILLPEGCLSVKGENNSAINGSVARPTSIAIDFFDLHGKSKHLEIDGNQGEYRKWFARCLQHELDHLDGILFTDHLSETSIDIAGQNS